jgi:predicted Zn finger-like uncharacterized protein
MAAGLATRCSACGTVFRVVPDQLRVSEGWVRCGRCTQVFNALESLVDLETGMPRRSGVGLAPLVEESPDGDFEFAQPAAKPGAPPLPPMPPPAAPPPSSRISASQQLDPPSAAGDTESLTTQLDSVAEFFEDSQATEKPSFVRSAERAERWRSRPVRLALLVVAVLAAVGLVAQIGIEYRERLAARMPVLRPVLEQACAPLGCVVGAARAIESLAVESSGLVRVEKSNIYRLQVTLRNRDTLQLAVPALDVTLTDSQGDLIARKVLRLAELGASQATIGAGRELSVQATLQASAGTDGAVQPIAGYTIELFYP